MELNKHNELKKVFDEKLNTAKEEADKYNYSGEELRFVDDEGNDKAKGAMKLVDMIAIASVNNNSLDDVVQMLFSAVTDELKEKSDEK